MKELNEMELREVEGGLISPWAYVRIIDCVGSNVGGFVCGLYSGMYKSIDALFN